MHNQPEVKKDTKLRLTLGLMLFKSVASIKHQTFRKNTKVNPNELDENWKDPDLIQAHNSFQENKVFRAIFFTLISVEL